MIHLARSVLLVPLTSLVLSACGTKSESGDPFSAPGTGGGNGSSPQASSFFTSNVKPAFQSKCVSCHSITFRFGAAPATIYNEPVMRTLLIEGSSAEANRLMQYARGLTVGHPQTDSCGGNSNESPCLEIKEWYRREVTTPGGNSLPAGRIDSISVRGEVRGSALDPDSGDPVGVQIYLDGPRGSGTLLATITANQDFGYYPGLHGFKYSLPASTRDATNRSIYVYAIDIQTNEASQLGQSPKPFKLYSPKEAGIAFYNANIVPKFQAKCIECHSAGSSIYDHNSTFYSVGESTTPYFSGTATNNSIYNKSSGRNHGGGNQCIGANDPCPDLQTWFGLQFN